MQSFIKHHLPKIIVGVGLAVYAVRVWLFDQSNDFEVFYRTSERFLSGRWDLLYTLADHAGLFRYPPLALPLLGWLSWFPFQWAREMWFFLNVGAMAAGMVLLVNAWGGGARARVQAWWIAVLCLRPALDSLINSQVDGLMFLGLSLALWALRRQPSSAVGFAAGIYLPSVLKIGTLLLAPLAIWRSVAFLKRVVWATLGITAGLVLVVALGARGFSGLGGVLQGWWINMQTVLVPSSNDYIECMDFRSQAINSALLRASLWGWWDVTTAHRIWLLCVALGLSLYAAAFWFWRTSKPVWALFGLGVLAYLLLMPFTYRRTLMFIAIPLFPIVAAWWERPRSASLAATLAAVVLTISLPGKDIVGDTLFFAVQRLSLPVLATLGLALAVVDITSRVTRRR